MKEFENNAYFWQKLETLYVSSGYTLRKKKGEIHDEYQNLIYPTDYGKINVNGNNGASVYLGSSDRNKITAVIVAADILARELDVKVLAGCNEEEMEDVLMFLNQTEFQKTVLLRKTNVVPQWSEEDNDN